MATKNIDIVVKAKDEASKTFDNIAQNSASFSEKVKANLTKISVVSTAITWGLVAMWKKFIDAWNVQIEQETKLTTILKQRANATDAQIQKIKDLASAEQNLWIVWDEVQLAWAQQLATFVNQTETIEKLLPAMNNLKKKKKWYNNNMRRNKYLKSHVKSFAMTNKCIDKSLNHVHWSTRTSFEILKWRRKSLNACSSNHWQRLRNE